MATEQALTPAQETVIQNLENQVESGTFSLPPLADNAKTNTRLIAMQAIYALLQNPLLTKDDDAVADFADAFCRARLGAGTTNKAANFRRPFFDAVLGFYVKNEQLLTESLAPHMGASQKLPEIDQTVHAFLLAAMAELFAFPDTDAVVVINETIDLSCAFVDDKTSAFMQGVLNAAVKTVKG